MSISQFYGIEINDFAVSVARTANMAFIWGKGEIETKLDYVICWYKKAIDYIRGTAVKVAFVSTNSICQGESVPTFWKKMIDDGAVINFAYRPLCAVDDAGRIIEGS